jgi:hypothetical protein
VTEGSNGFDGSSGLSPSRRQDRRTTTHHLFVVKKQKEKRSAAGTGLTPVRLDPRDPLNPSNPFQPSVIDARGLPMKESI